MTWYNKKQYIVFISIVEAKYVIVSQDAKKVYKFDNVLIISY